MGCVSANILTINILVDPAHREEFVGWFDKTYKQHKRRYIIDHFPAVVCIPDIDIVYWQYYTHSAALIVIYGELSQNFATDSDQLVARIDGRSASSLTRIAAYASAISAACRALRRVA